MSPPERTESHGIFVGGSLVSLIVFVELVLKAAGMGWPLSSGLSTCLALAEAINSFF